MVSHIATNSGYPPMMYRMNPFHKKEGGWPDPLIIEEESLVLAAQHHTCTIYIITINVLYKSSPKMYYINLQHKSTS